MTDVDNLDLSAPFTAALRQLESDPEMECDSVVWEGFTSMEQTLWSTLKQTLTSPSEE